MAWATLYQMIACLAVTLCLRCDSLSVVLSQAQPVSQALVVVMIINYGK